MESGNIYVPLNPKLPLNRLEYIAKLAQIKALIVCPSSAAKAAELLELLDNDVARDHARRTKSFPPNSRKFCRALEGRRILRRNRFGPRRRRLRVSAVHVGHDRQSQGRARHPQQRFGLHRVGLGTFPHFTAQDRFHSILRAVVRCFHRRHFPLLESRRVPLYPLLRGVDAAGRVHRTA